MPAKKTVFNEIFKEVMDFISDLSENPFKLWIGYGQDDICAILPLAKITTIKAKESLYGTH